MEAGTQDMAAGGDGKGKGSSTVWKDITEVRRLALIMQ